VAELSQLKQLEAQRRQLVAQSDALRQHLARDLAPLARTATQVERGFAWLQRLRPFWPLVAGAAGLLATRKGSGVFNLVRKGLAWWQFARKLMGLRGLFSSLASDGEAAEHPRES
jgi:hypothetical protein